MVRCNSFQIGWNNVNWALRSGLFIILLDSNQLFIDDWKDFFDVWTYSKLGISTNMSFLGWNRKDTNRVKCQYKIPSLIRKWQFISMWNWDYSYCVFLLSLLFCEILCFFFVVHIFVFIFHFEEDVTGQKKLFEHKVEFTTWSM